MYREYGKWWSPSLAREMEFLWFGQFGRPVMLFPTSAGRFFENENEGLTGSLSDKVERGEIQLVLVDTVNEESWYNRSVPPGIRAARCGARRAARLGLGRAPNFGPPSRGTSPHSPVSSHQLA